MNKIKASYKKINFRFTRPAGTSRGVLTEKVSWFIVLYFEESPFVKGIGECSPLPGLSSDDVPGFEQKLTDICNLINKGLFNFAVRLNNFPAIQFGIEMAMKDLKAGGSKILFPSDFTLGNDAIPINGLIWMGEKEYIYKQINEKLEKGFRCLKVKIGALDFEEEYKILQNIRNQFPASDLEVRVDANGAFHPNKAYDILCRLAELELHSIEQPILPAQIEDMARLCLISPLPIALDEELIGKFPVENKKKLLDIIKPQFIILKPTLLGGFHSCEEWIEIANEMEIGWWITSALESNIGLNAIAQWTYTLENKMPQGLGTGQIYMNNIRGPLALLNDTLRFFPHVKWDLKQLM